MEETKNTKPASQPEKDKKNKDKKEKKAKKNGSFFAEHKAELRKVTWPNRQELTKETITVITVSIIIGIIIFAMDTALSYVYNAVTGGGSQNSVTSAPNDSNVYDLENLPEGVEIVTGDEAGETEAAESADETAAEADDAAADDENTDDAAADDENAESGSDTDEADDAEDTEGAEAEE